MSIINENSWGCKNRTCSPRSKFSWTTNILNPKAILKKKDGIPISVAYISQLKFSNLFPIAPWPQWVAFFDLGVNVQDIDMLRRASSSRHSVRQHSSSNQLNTCIILVAKRCKPSFFFFVAPWRVELQFSA